MAFYEDINKEILGEYLTEEQLDEVMSISNCLVGVSVGQAIIIALWGLLWESGLGGPIEPPAEPVPADVLTFEGEPLFFQGNYLTFTP